VVTVAITGATLFLKQYLTKKADNLATKEDLADLTRPVEAIKLEFRLQEERARAMHSRELAAHQVLFEHEFTIYRDLWKQVLEVRTKIDQYSPQALLAAKFGSAISVPGYKEVKSAAEELDQYLKLHKPFFAPDVNFSLQVFHLSVGRIAAQTAILTNISDEEVEKHIDKIVKELAETQYALESAIRSRLYPNLWLPAKPSDANPEEEGPI